MSITQKSTSEIRLTGSFAKFGNLLNFYETITVHCMRSLLIVKSLLLPSLFMFLDQFQAFEVLCFYLLHSFYDTKIVSFILFLFLNINKNLFVF